MTGHIWGFVENVMPWNIMVSAWARRKAVWKKAVSRKWKSLVFCLFRNGKHTNEKQTKSYRSLCMWMEPAAWMCGVRDNGCSQLNWHSFTFVSFNKFIDVMWPDVECWHATGDDNSNCRCWHVVISPYNQTDYETRFRCKRQLWRGADNKSMCERKGPGYLRRDCVLTQTMLFKFIHFYLRGCRVRS